MKMSNEQRISIKEKKVCFHTPAQDVVIDLTGNVGDAIVAHIIPSVLQDKEIKLPNGEELYLPYLIGKITKVTPIGGRSPDVRYDFTVGIDMEDGTKLERKDCVYHKCPGVRWSIAPHDDCKPLKISDYREYTRYAKERREAYEAFCKEWDEKNPIKLER